MKIIPADNNKKTVVLEEIDIFLESVGILLTNNNAISTVRNGVKLFISNLN